MVYSVEAGSRLVLPRSECPSSQAMAPSTPPLPPDPPFVFSPDSSELGRSEKDRGDVSGLSAWRIAG